MNVLVTGGAGYVGSRLVQKLYSCYGIDAIMLDNHLGPFQSHTCNILGDITGPHDVRDAMQGIGAVVHLAAIVGEAACAKDEKKAFETNVIGANIVANEALDTGIKRFVFASTGNVYGRTDKEAVESDPPKPLCIYGDQKIMAEAVVTGAGYTVVRFGTVCGVSPRMRWDLLPHAMVKAAVEGERFDVYSPSAWRPYTHIEDATDAIIELVSREPNAAISGKVFNVVSENLRKIDLVGMMDSVMPDTPNVIRLVDKPGKRNYRMSGELIEKTIGWKGKRTVREAMVDVLKELENAD